MDSLVYETLYLADNAARAAGLERSRLVQEARAARRDGRRHRFTTLLHTARGHTRHA